MKLTSLQFFKNAPKGGARLCRLLPATLCLLILTAVPALAEPVTIKQVLQTLTSSKATDLRLTTIVAQDPATPTKGGSQQSGPRNETQVSQSGIKTDTIISGITVTSDGKPAGVDIIEEGEVDGSICDCGDILVAGGAFPKWPFLFLAAVPLAFINECETCGPTPTPTPPSIPTPTQTPTSVPEPASLLMFGTGLLAAGAGLRRRYARSKLARHNETREEE